MKLSELIAKYGDDKVQFQNLDQCTKTIDYSAKNGTSVTFGTSENISVKGSEGMERLGIVVWLDREAVAKIIAEERA